MIRPRAATRGEARRKLASRRGRVRIAQKIGAAPPLRVRRESQAPFDEAGGLALPETPIERVRTGQRDGERELWSAEFAPGGG